MPGASSHPAAEPQLGATHVDVTVVSTPSCHYCADAEQALTVIADRYPIHVRVVELQSPEGLRLTARHRPAMSPLVLVDGRFFSAGRLPRKKLLAMLRGAAVAGASSSDGPSIAS
jgi:glutaredoxin